MKHADCVNKILNKEKNVILAHAYLLLHIKAYIMIEPFMAKQNEMNKSKFLKYIFGLGGVVLLLLL